MFDPPGTFDSSPPSPGLRTSLPSGDKSAEKVLNLGLQITCSIFDHGPMANPQKHLGVSMVMLVWLCMVYFMEHLIKWMIIGGYPYFRNLHLMFDV